MLKKTVQCPSCSTLIELKGNPGDIVKIKCEGCGTEGKVTFEQTSPISSDSSTAIEVQNLRKEYGDLVAVNDISFKVKKGEVFAFLGPNGAGKTTTVEMIESIRIPTAGKISLLGKESDTSFNEVKDKIGILPQEFHSFERLTVKETLEYFSKFYKKSADLTEITKAMDLGEQENKFYMDLSGGLKQRVGVAVSLVNNPEIVFLDEPSTGLDPKARREVWDVIAGLRDRGKTVFLTTHYMEEAEYLADHIAIIHKGKIIAEGTLEELIEKHGKHSMLKIKDCQSKEIINILKNKGFDAKPATNGDISVRIEHKEKVLDILSILKHECVDYSGIDIRRANLEQIFLKLTGAKLSEGEI